MQFIKHKENNNNVHPIMDELDNLYALTSEKIEKPKLIPTTLDSSFQMLCEIFEDYSPSKYKFTFSDKQYKALDLPEYDSKNIIVCFSGGKDSLAAVLYYKQRGYNVYLYHLKNVNPIFDEYRATEELAEKLECPLFIDEVTVSGHHDWIEHPMKNMVIANNALNYGIKNNITTKIAFGNYYEGGLFNDAFAWNAGDDIEMWMAYESIMQRAIPGFQMELCLANLGTTLDMVCGERELLDSTISCLGRAGLRDYRRQWVKDKFDIELPKHRCGSCYKCAVEYIYMADHDLQKYSPEYYKYCLDRLVLNRKRETGDKLSIEELWPKYFFYDMSVSKYLQSKKDVI